jgi:hypothetical protein
MFLNQSAFIDNFENSLPPYHCLARSLKLKTHYPRCAVQVASSVVYYRYVYLYAICKQYLLTSNTRLCATKLTFLGITYYL